MKPKAYHEMFAHEDQYWWYRVLDELVFRFIDEMALPASPTVLDAGCGTGRLLAKLQTRQPTMGIDFSPLALDYCAKRGLRSQLGQASLNALPFVANQFDLIVSCDVLYHRAVEDQRALNELYRVLKPNGKLILHLPALEALRGTHDEQVDGRERYTTTSIRQRVEQAGLRVIKCSYRLMFTLPLIYALRKFKQSEGESDFSELSPSTDFLITTLMRFENQLISRVNLPIGSSVFLVAEKI